MIEKLNELRDIAHSLKYCNSLMNKNKIIDKILEDIDLLILKVNAPVVLYEFCYNDNIHESSTATMSVHRTRKGAEDALAAHKDNKYKEWENFINDMSTDTNVSNNKYIDEYKEYFPFSRHEEWSVGEITVQN